MKTISDFYDLISSTTKTEEVLQEELALINKWIPKQRHILDIGCGTGRHLLPLLEAGYAITGLDSNSKHLHALRQKTKLKPELICSELSKANLERKSFDALLLFWNSLNEICLNITDLNEFFTIATKILKPKGLILINIDDTNLIDPSKLDFTYTGFAAGRQFSYTFKVKEYNRIERMTHSHEKVTIKGEKTIEEYEGELIQKWWDSKEIENMALRNGFTTVIEKIRSNNELYLILTKE